MYNTCPSSDTLARFAEATLADHEAAKIVTHLATCETCSRKVDELEHRSEQPMLAALRDLRNEPIANDDPPLPKTIGQYEILEKIGQGGMGIVYRAVHPHLKREVALKVIRDSRLDDPAARERFVQEMQALGRLAHPNIVHATDAGIDGNIPFIVTELLDGEDLGTWIAEHGKMPVKQAVDCIRQAATGLAYAHKASYIHRDIKPSNLFLLRDGTVKILDLGIARPMGDNSSQTVTGHVVGSPDFMAPEQFRGGTADARSDIYSLGQTFLYIITGKHDDVSGFPLQFKRMLVRMTAGTPSLRYQTADELIEAVDALLRTKRGLWMPVLIGTLLFVGIVTVAGLPRKEKQRGTVASAVNATPFSPQFSAEEQAEIDGYIASFVAGRGIDVHGKYEDGWTLLHSAVAVDRNIAVAKYLVSLGADVNARCDFGSTPLHLAVSQGSTEMARFLVSQGADVNARTNVNNTPLHYAVDNSNVAVAKYLVSQGADVQARNSFGKTPLDLARERGGLGAVAEYLSSLR